MPSMLLLLLPAVLASTTPGKPADQAAQPEPVGLVRALETAVDRGRADSARQAWRLANRRRPGDVAPRFALATLDRLEHRRGQARVGFTAVARLPGAGATGWRAAARLALGRLQVSNGDPAGPALLRAAISTADSAGAPSIGAAAMLDLARIVARVGALDSAARLIERARLSAPATDTAATALAWCAAGGALVTSAAARADSLIERGTALAKAAGDGRVSSRCLLTAYQAAMTRGLPARSLGPLNEALRAINLTRDAEASATIHQLSAFMYIQFSFGLGNGRRLAGRAIQLARLSGNRLAEGYAHLNLAQLAIRLGDFGAAAGRRDSAVALLRAIGDRPGQAAAEFVGGDAAFAVGDLVKAEGAYRAALDIYRQLRSPVSGVTQRLAMVAMDRRAFAEARRLLDDAATESTRLGNRGFLADKQYYDALLALRDGRPLEAAAGFRAYREALSAGAFQYQLDAGTREAEALALAGRLGEAEVVLDSAIAAIERVRREVLYEGTGRNRDVLMALAANRRFEFDPDLGFATIVAALAAANRVESAFRFAEAERARTLWVRLTRRAVLGDSAATRPPPLLVPNELPLGELTRALGDDTAILAFSTGAGGEPTTVFVLDRRGVRAFAAPAGDSLAVPIERFANLARAGTWARPLGRSLGAALLDRPLATLAPTVRRLIVIPDGPVFRLPLDALPLPDGAPLLSRYEVAIAPSARLAGHWLTRPAGPPAAGIRVVAFGDPRFDPGFALPRLRGSGTEARIATDDGRRGVSFLGAAATEAAFRKLDSIPAAVIHLATHARTEDAGVLSSAVYLAPGGGHDGRIGPEDIASRRLSVDLVLLTGCRTSGGALMFGEGIQGLVAPFLEAGARAVIATLWDVGDQAIVPLVRRFYAELARGADAGSALCAARLAGWRAGESPTIWAALTLTGDSRVAPLTGRPAR